MQIWAADFTEVMSERPSRTFGLVTNLAMLEHLASSPKALLENLRALTDPDGLLFVDVPNIAYWPNRLKLLRGMSIHQSLELMYDSEPPFLGHHREYTTEELVKVLRWSGFEVLTTEAFNYSPKLRGSGLYDRLMTLFFEVLPSLLTPCNREVLLAIGAPLPDNAGTIEPLAPSDE